MVVDFADETLAQGGVNLCWAIPSSLTAYRSSDRLAWVHLLIERWLQRQIACRAEREGREFVHLTADALSYIIGATRCEAESYQHFTFDRPGWILHHVALHERRLRAGREPTAHERAWNEVRLRPLRREIEIEREAAAEWWSGLNTLERGPYDEIRAMDEIEWQVAAFRPALAWAAEEHAAVLARRQSVLPRQVARVSQVG